MEIFDKAREYTRTVYDDDDIESVVHKYMPRRQVADWRLHKQSLKVFAMAVEQATQTLIDKAHVSNGHELPIGSLKAQDVLDVIDDLERKQGQGWQRVKNGNAVWYYKDYEHSDEMIGTLGFLQRLGIKFEQFNGGQFNEALHLRIPEENYDLIFNPKRDVERCMGLRD